MTGVLVVRRRTDVDLDALAQVVARVRAADDYPTYLPGDDYHRLLTRPEPLEAWVSEWNSDICGHVALNTQPSPGAMQVLHDAGIVGPLGAIARLLVDPDVRAGVSPERCCKRRNPRRSEASPPVLEVVESSHAAIALYRQSGWVELGRTSLALRTGGSYGSSSSRLTGRSTRRWRKAAYRDTRRRSRIPADVPRSPRGDRRPNARLVQRRSGRGTRRPIPPAIELAADGGIYVLVDDGPPEGWRYESFQRRLDPAFADAGHVHGGRPHRPLRRSSFAQPDRAQDVRRRPTTK